MLAVGIHHQHMGEARCGGGAQTVEHRSALAAIGGAVDDVQARLILLQRRAAAIGAAVNDYPNGLPMAQRLGNGFNQPRTGIVARE